MRTYKALSKVVRTGYSIERSFNGRTWLVVTKSNLIEAIFYNREEAKQYIYKLENK